MKTQKEIEKGCGKRIITPDMTSSCGDISFANKILYCPTCQALFQQSKEFVEMIDKCKIHTAGVLILIEKKELKSSIIGSEEK